MIINFYNLWYKQYHNLGFGTTSDITWQVFPMASLVKTSLEKKNSKKLTKNQINLIQKIKVFNTKIKVKFN